MLIFPLVACRNISPVPNADKAPGPLAEEEGSSEAMAGCDKGRREGKEAQDAAPLVSVAGPCWSSSTLGGWLTTCSWAEVLPADT